MLDELTKTVKAQLYERISSPLSSSFAISWSAWNYKFYIICLSSLTAIDKISAIESIVFTDNLTILLNGFIYPLSTALAFIFIYPIPAKIIYKYARNRQRELKEIQQQIDDETPLTQEEARELRRSALKATIELEDHIENLTNENNRLKELVKSADKKAAPANEHHSLNTLDTIASLNKLVNAIPSNEKTPPDINERILLQEDQFMEESLKNILMIEPSFEGMKFTLDVRDRKVTLNKLPSNLSGKGVTFSYDFHRPTGGNLMSEVTRISNLIRADILREKNSEKI